MLVIAGLVIAMVSFAIFLWLLLGYVGDTLDVRLARQDDDLRVSSSAEDNDGTN